MSQMRTPQIITRFSTTEVPVKYNQQSKISIEKGEQIIEASRNTEITQEDQILKPTSEAFIDASKRSGLT
jgi:hypothetical protein